MSFSLTLTYRRVIATLGSINVGHLNSCVPNCVKEGNGAGEDNKRPWWKKEQKHKRRPIQVRVGPMNDMKTIAALVLALWAVVDVQVRFSHSSYP